MTDEDIQPVHWTVGSFWSFIQIYGFGMYKWLSQNVYHICSKQAEMVVAMTHCKFEMQA